MTCAALTLNDSLKKHHLLFLMQGVASSLLNSNGRIELLLNYLEDGDLRRWRLPDIQAFSIGISEWRSKLNCIVNPHMFDQVCRESSGHENSFLYWIMGLL